MAEREALATSNPPCAAPSLNGRCHSSSLRAASASRSDQSDPGPPRPVERMRFALVSRDSGRFERLREVFDRNFSSLFVVGDPDALRHVNDTTTLHGVVIDGLDEEFNPIDVIHLLRPTIPGALIALIRSDDELTRILALESGADDCLGVQFSPRELLARLRAVVRRTGSTTPESESVIELGDIRMSRDEFRVTVADRECKLTNAEFAVLERLMTAGGSIVTREELTFHALGRELQVEDRSIDVHISRLRQKIGPTADRAQRILSVRGRGYRIRSE